MTTPRQLLLERARLPDETIQTLSVLSAFDGPEAVDRAVADAATENAVAVPREARGRVAEAAGGSGDDSSAILEFLHGPEPS